MANKVGIFGNGVFIGAMRFPDRKRPCLVVERGNERVVIGAFTSEWCVDYFEKSLREVTEGGVENGSE